MSHNISVPEQATFRANNGTVCVNIGSRTLRVSECSVEHLLAYGGGLRDSRRVRVDLGLT